MGIIVAVIVIVSIFVTVYRVDKLAKKNKQAKCEQVEEKTTPAGSLYYSDNPYLNGDDGRTMTAAQYEEWLCDYRIARRTGAKVTPPSSPLAPSLPAPSPVSLREIRDDAPCDAPNASAPAPLALRDDYAAHFRA